MSAAMRGCPWARANRVGGARRSSHRRKLGRASTSKPGAWKAHGPARPGSNSPLAEPRLAGLLQAAKGELLPGRIAGLKQPSLRRMIGETLRRRIIVLVQSTELDRDASRTSSLFGCSCRIARVKEKGWCGKRPHTTG